MYIFLRSCYFRNLRSNKLVKSRSYHSTNSDSYISDKISHGEYFKLSSQIRTFSSINCSHFSPVYNTKDGVNRRNDFQNNDINILIIRPISSSAARREKEPLKPSSKVEVTVKVLKDEQKIKESLPAEVAHRTVQKKSIKQKIVDELVHYYHGFRLLFIDIRVSCGLVWRILNGKPLTRREHRLLIRTVGDLFRLVPFSVFIIVPFMELALPIFIKFFPGMLPSTFQTTKEREDKLKQNLKMKLEMAKFLQQTLDEMAVQHTDRRSESAKDFVEWFHKVRTSGEVVSNEDIIKFSKLFQDEITLDSLSRGQLVALCRVLEVQTLGTNNLLRFQLRMKLRSLAADDKLIQKEGIDSLTVNELQQACKSRGMRAYGLSEERLRKQLTQWLDLSLNQKVPPSLLLLSRALMLPDTIPTSDKLKATISALPDTIVTQTTAAIGESEGKIDNKVKLEVLKEEVRKVKEERIERREERKRKEEEDKEILVDKAPVITAESTPELQDKAFVQEQPVVAAETKKKAEQISSTDLGVLEDALDSVTKGKKTLILEKEVIEDLKEEMADYQEDLQELKEVTSNVTKPEITESKAAKRLFTSVNKMIQKMDVVVSELESKEQQLKKELAGGESKVTKQDLVHIDELLDAIKQIQKVPNESVLQQIQNILGKMDDDHDGSLKVEDVLKVIEVIGKDNVQLSPKQMEELIELIDKEEILEVEDKIEKALQKEADKKAVIKGKGADKSNKPTESIETKPKSSPDQNNGSNQSSKSKVDAQSQSGITPPTINIERPKKGNNAKML